MTNFSDYLKGINFRGIKYSLVFGLKFAKINSVKFSENRKFAKINSAKKSILPFISQKYFRNGTKSE